MNRAFELNKIDLDLKIDGFIDLEMVKHRIQYPEAWIYK